jgi:transcriptional antiterminator RfaH
LEAEEAIINLVDELQNGDKIRIQYGPFQGYEAIFNTRIPGTERVRVLLKLLSDRLVSIELNADTINRIE